MLTVHQFIVLQTIWIAECPMSPVDIHRTLIDASIEQCFNVLEELVKLGYVTYSHKGYELTPAADQIVNVIAGVWQ